MIITKNPIFYALDFADKKKAIEMLKKIHRNLGGIKIGLEFFVVNGMSGLQEIAKLFNLPIFLDLKLYDIPNTVAKTIKEICKIEEICMTTLHITGGPELMIAAHEARFRKNLYLIGITILTSSNSFAKKSLNESLEISKIVSDMAHIAQKIGLNGVVCSGLENEIVRDTCGAKFLIVNPGIRLEIEEKADQKRVVTPEFAIETGANYLVIGRSITNSTNPEKKLEEILETLQ